MDNYIKYLQESIDKEQEYISNEDENKITYKSIVQDCSIFPRGYIAKLEQIEGISKNPMSFQEEENIIIENKVFGTIIESRPGFFECKIKTYLKPNTIVLVKRQENNILKIKKIFEKFVRSNKYIHECIVKSFTTGYKNIQAEKTFDYYKISQNRVNYTDTIDNNVVIELKNKDLNKSQISAINLSLKNESYKILGPPGTGKTTTIVEIIFQLLKHKKKILVCGPSNTSVDNILLGFLKLKYDCIFFRLGSSIKCYDGFQNFNLFEMAESSVDFLCCELNDMKMDKSNFFSKNEYKTKDKAKFKKIKSKDVNLKEINKNIIEVTKEKKKRIDKFCYDKTKNANIIFSTLFSSMKLQDVSFDYVIVDECCQAFEVESLMAVCKGKTFILAGDPYQLGAVIKSGTGISLFERIDVKTIWLCEQYRMNSNLIEFSNNFFYKNKVLSYKKDNFKFFNESNIVFIDTYDSYFVENDEEKSISNQKEAEIVILLMKYIEELMLDLKIGIISPYSAQISLIKEMMESFTCDIKINTVDSFQGQERDIIIISLVRSNIDEEIGFLSEIRRMNVAITRCKKGLVVIGDSSTFRKKKFYGEFMDYLYEKAFCIDPETLKHYI